MIINRLAAAKKTLVILGDNRDLQDDILYNNALDVIRHYYKTGAIKFAVLPMKALKKAGN